MSTRYDPAEILDTLALSTPQQRVLRATVAAAAAVFLVLVSVVGGSHPVLTTLGVLLALLAAVLPESHAPLALLLFLGVLWLVATPDRLDGWTLLAAVDLLVVHLAATLVSHGPPGLRLDARLLRAWLGRSLLCAGAAGAVWGVSLLARSPGRRLGSLAVALALLVVLGWCVALVRRMAGGRRLDADGG